MAKEKNKRNVETETTEMGTDEESVLVEIVDKKEKCIVGHYSDRYIAMDGVIDFTAYQFRLKIRGDDNEDERCQPPVYTCVIYMGPDQAKELSTKLQGAIKEYEKEHGRFVGKIRGC